MLNISTTFWVLAILTCLLSKPSKDTSLLLYSGPDGTAKRRRKYYQCPYGFRLIWVDLTILARPFSSKVLNRKSCYWVRDIDQSFQKWFNSILEWISDKGIFATSLCVGANDACRSYASECSFLHLYSVVSPSVRHNTKKLRRLSLYKNIDIFLKMQCKSNVNLLILET